MAVLYFYPPHPEVALDGVEHPAGLVQKLQLEVVEVGDFGAPEGHARPLGEVGRFGRFATTQERQATFEP